MAKITGSTGQSARMLAQRRRFLRKMGQLVAAAGVFVMLWVFLKSGVTSGGIVGMVVCVIFIGALKWLDRASTETDRHLRKRTRDAERGAKGEDTIGALLATLPDGYTVFHDLAKLYGDIDHIVVGPTGLFTIETKAHGGKVTAQGNRVLVNGHPPEKDFIAQSWRNAFWVREVLKNTAEIDGKVIPILVFPNAFVTGRGTKGVRVINKKYLVETILNTPPADLPTERIVEILQRKMGPGQQ